MNRRESPLPARPRVYAALNVVAEKSHIGAFRYLELKDARARIIIPAAHSIARPAPHPHH
jgi:hypothetical protein